MRFLNVVACMLLGLVIALSSSAQAEEPSRSPEENAMLDRLSGGLKLIASGDFDGWIAKYCSKEHLCRNTSTNDSLLRYNLPALKGVAKKCFENGSPTFVVTRKDNDPATETTVKYFLDCHTGGRPQPFYMVKESGVWNFMKI